MDIYVNIGNSLFPLKSLISIISNHDHSKHFRVKVRVLACKPPRVMYTYLLIFHQVLQKSFHSQWISRRILIFLLPSIGGNCK